MELFVGQVPEGLIEAASHEFPRTENGDDENLFVCHIGMLFLSRAIF